MLQREHMIGGLIEDKEISAYKSLSINSKLLHIVAKVVPTFLLKRKYGHFIGIVLRGFLGVPFVLYLIQIFS